MNERRDFIAGAALGAGAERFEPVKPFVRKYPPEALRMWRGAFEQLYACPALATAGTFLVDELARAYAALERER